MKTIKTILCGLAALLTGLAAHAAVPSTITKFVTQHRFLKRISFIRRSPEAVFIRGAPFLRRAIKRSITPQRVSQSSSRSSDPGKGV